jgi:hypothetical protein
MRWLQISHQESPESQQRGTSKNLSLTRQENLRKPAFGLAKRKQSNKQSNGEIPQMNEEQCPDKTCIHTWLVSQPERGFGCVRDEPVAKGGQAVASKMQQNAARWW